MKTKRSEAKNESENRKIGGELAEQGQMKSAVRISKLHADYWRKRLFHEGFTREGRRVLSGFWSVRIYRARRREAFNLETANAAEAAIKAKDIYATLLASGWHATLTKFKPTAIEPAKVGTVGGVIDAARSLCTTRPQSFAQAAMRLRQIAAEITGVERPKNATAYRAPAFAAWREKVDAVPLSKITPTAVRGWRDARIAARSDNPVERRAATISADATIRMARSIFAKRILAAGLGTKVSLPSPLPFSGVTVGGSTKRFSERIDVARLFAAARTELESDSPEVFRAFVLCLLAGLRRSEADRLTWAQLDLDSATLSIERTEYFEPKSEESNRQVELDPVAVEILRRAKADDPDPIFVLKGSSPRPQTSAAPVYRANTAPWRTWEKLANWLEERGIRDGKPIHVLRKLAGSLVFSAHGLEQARGFLGHASVVTTSNSYLAKSRRVMVSIPAPADEVSRARAKRRVGT